MKKLSVLFYILCNIGIFWLSIRVVFIEWVLIKESFWNFINPWIHVKALLYLLKDLDIYVILCFGGLAYFFDKKSQKNEKETDKEKQIIQERPRKKYNVRINVKWILLILLAFIILVSFKNYIEKSSNKTLSKCFRLYEKTLIASLPPEIFLVHDEMQETGNSKFCKLWIRNINYMNKWMAYEGTLELLDKYGARLDYISLPFRTINKGETIILKVPYSDNFYKAKADMKFYNSKDMTNFHEELNKLKNKFPTDNFIDCANYKDIDEKYECFAMFFLEEKIKFRQNLKNKLEEKTEIDFLEQQNNKYY